MSGLINKVKEKLSSDKENPNSATHGTHNSDAMNKADPRFDSDRDNRDNYTTGHTGGHTTGTGYGNTVHDTTTTGTTGLGSTGHTTHGSSNAGPHNSNALNKVDPRVDSDRDNRNDPLSRTGGYGTQEGYGAQGSNPMPSSGGYGTSTTGHSGLGSSGTTGHSGLAGSAGTTGPTSTNYGGSSNAGPHNSNMMNKMDPRVDSDRDNRNDPLSRTGGYGTQENYGAQGSNPMPSSGGYGSNTTGGYGSSTTGHSSGLGSTGHTTGHSGTTGAGYGDQYGSSATPGSGNAASTAGPHNSNLLNKLDPRVDSNLDGSKTVGGNKTNY